jgi:uncharacterized protein
VPRFDLQLLPETSSAGGAGGPAVRLPPDVLRDVIQVTYKDNIKEIDSLELTINNWSPEAHQFKYEGFDYDPARPPAGTTEHGQRAKLFDPCNREFELRMGYGVDLPTMMRGTFTSVEPVFAQNGASTLNVRGLNIMHKLRQKQYSDHWGEMRDSDIAKDIGRKRDRGQPRFPLPIEIDPPSREKEEIRPYVAQENQYDIDFLFGLARRKGYVVVISEGDERNPNRHLFFGPSLTTANQVKSVTVRGWDRRRRRPIEVKVDLDDPQLRRRNRDLRELLDRCDPREEVVVDRPVFTEQEARTLARAILMDRHKEMVKASGTVVGLPDLRAGRTVFVTGLGPRFSGTYFVTETTHTLNDSGYITTFKARREDESLSGAQA